VWNHLLALGSHPNGRPLFALLWQLGGQRRFLLAGRHGPREGRPWDGLSDSVVRGPTRPCISKRLDTGPCNSRFQSRDRDAFDNTDPSSRSSAGALDAIDDGLSPFSSVLPELSWHPSRSLSRLRRRNFPGAPCCAYGYGQFLEATWQAYGGDIPWRATDSQEQARPVGQRRDSTNYRYALPAMARYLCAEGAGQDLRKAIFAYNRADWYVAEVLQLAARYGGIGAAGGGLIDGWADRPPLNQYDRRFYRSDQTWSAWRNADCSAAALDWLLGAYGQQLPALDDAVVLIGPGTGISPSLGLLDARGPALAQALAARGLKPRTPGKEPLGSISELKAWLDRGPLLLDGASWFVKGHWFVAIGYDQNGVYTRDSSGWDTRYLTWSRLYGEVGFSGWVVGVAA
jgi:hypothetical protein